MQLVIKRFFVIFIVCTFVAVFLVQNTTLATQTTETDCTDITSIYTETPFYVPEGCAPAGVITGNSCESVLLPTIVDVNVVSDAINKYIDEKGGSNSPFAGLGSKFVEGGMANGINPFVAVLHAQKESGFGATSILGWHNYTFATQAAAGARDESQLSPSHNAYGRSSGSSQPTVWYPSGTGMRAVYKWNSWEESLVGSGSFFEYYKSKWVEEQKLTTFDEIIQKYAPASDGNDPTSYAGQMKKGLQTLTDMASSGINCGGGIFGSSGANGSKLSGEDNMKLSYGYYLGGGQPSMTYFNQNDERFQGSEGKSVYPNGSPPFDECGCFPTSMAMAINTIGSNKEVSPLDIGKEVANSGKTDNGCGYSGGAEFALTLASKFNVKIKSITSFSDAKEGLRNGGIVVVSTFGPSDFTSSGHYIVIRGVTVDGKFAIANPERSDQSLNNSFEESYMDTWSNNNDGRMWVISQN